MKPPMTVNLSLSLAYWVATLAAETGSGAKAMATGPDEEGVALRADRAVESLRGQGVLHHLQLGAFVTKAAPQIGHFRNGQTLVVGHDHGAGASEHAFQRFDGVLLLSAVHCGLHTQVQAYARMRTPVSNLSCSEKPQPRAHPRCGGTTRRHLPVSL
jgi:hypothetical protein